MLYSAVFRHYSWLGAVTPAWGWTSSGPGDQNWSFCMQCVLSSLKYVSGFLKLLFWTPPLSLLYLGSLKLVNIAVVDTSFCVSSLFFLCAARLCLDTSLPWGALSCQFSLLLNLVYLNNTLSWHQEFPVHVHVVAHIL